MNPALWVPQPGPQTQAYDSFADELFYGGAQGGGKSDLILGLAATQHFWSVIFRRTFPLHRALIERSREILNPLRIEYRKDLYNESLHRWMLPSGQLIEFGAIEHEKDKENYRGRPHDGYFFDEVAQFSETQYRFVTAWCRSTKPGQRCRIVAAGNPPTTTEGEWVIRYWAPWIDHQHPRPAEPGELRWFARIGDKDVEVENGKPFRHQGRRGSELITPRSRTFIPALLRDNPILEKTGYLAVIQGLPEPLRSQALYGDFSIGLTDDAWQVIPTAWVRAAQKRWTERPPQRMTAMGVDVARGGAAQTVISCRHGPWFARLLKWPGHETQDGPTVARLIAKHHEAGADINIDAIGYGASAYDTLVKDFDYLQANIRPVNSAAKSGMFDRSNRFRLVNVRAALYWKLREALDPEHGSELALPPDRELEADLCSAHFDLTASGIKVEEKEDIEERVGRTIDCGDALLLAHWMTGGWQVPDAAPLAKADEEIERANPVRWWEQAEVQSRSAQRGHYGRGEDAD